MPLGYFQAKTQRGKPGPNAPHTVTTPLLETTSSTQPVPLSNAAILYGSTYSFICLYIKTNECVHTTSSSQERKQQKHNFKSKTFASFAGTPKRLSAHTWHYAWAFKKPRTLPTTSSSPLQTLPASSNLPCRAPLIILLNNFSRGVASLKTEPS